MHSATDTFRLTIELLGTTDDVTGYVIYVYKLNLATNRWERVRFVERLVSADFPYEIDGLTRGVYGVVVNAYLQSRRIITIISAIQNAGVPTSGGCFKFSPFEMLFSRRNTIFFVLTTF